MPPKVKIRGIETPKHLIEFFTAKGHKYIILEIADILKMDLPSRATLLDFLFHIKMETAPSGTPPADGYRNKIQNLGFNGYLRISIELLKDLTIKQLHNIQQWLSYYREIRASQNKPINTESCKCKGKNKKCNLCGGVGTIQVLVELSQIEENLATGKEWNEINQE